MAFPTFTTRFKITQLFVLLVTAIIFMLNWLIIQSANQAWEERKMTYMKQSMGQEYTVDSAKKSFGNVLVKRGSEVIHRQ